MKLLIGLIALLGMVLGDENDLEHIFDEANNRFTAKFFDEVVKQNPGKSAVLSAYSVLSPLALLSLGAEGESHDELLNNIYISNDNVTKAIFPLVNNNLRTVKGVTLKINGRIYVADEYPLRDEFIAVSRDVFDSDVRSVDFTHNIETAKAINTWVEDQTNNRIKDLVDPDSLDSDTRAVLVNAIYFKGLWKDKFNSSFTTEQPFYVSKEKSVPVPMMYRGGDYKFGVSRELEAQILEMPYEGDEVSFVVVLPFKIDGLNSLMEKIKNPLALSKALKNTYIKEVDVFIPKFKIETTTNLKDVLSNIGIKNIFEPSKAGLTKIFNNYDRPLYISTATQKAFIEVNEEGAEAAAANDFGMRPMSAPPMFMANHPFLFVLLKNQTTLFSGVYNPSA